MRYDIGVRVLMAMFVVMSSGALLAAPPSPAQTPELSQVRRVSSALLAGHAREATEEAEAGARRFPASALLRRRLAQARIALFVSLSRDYEVVLENARFARGLDSADRIFERIPTPPPSDRKAATQHDRLLRLRSFVTGQTADKLRDEAGQAIKLGANMLAHRRDVLQASLTDIKRARELGDRSTELDLTDLWARVLVLVWRQEIEGLKVPPAADAGNGGPELDLRSLENAMKSFTNVSWEDTAGDAAAIARKPNASANAMAGAADVLSVLSELSGRTDVLRQHTVKALNQRFVRGITPSREGKSNLFESYEQARTAKDPDPAKSPGTCAIQFYLAAAGAPGADTLDELPLRIYLLRVAYDRKTANVELDAYAATETRNAAVPLERARAELLLNGDDGRCLTQLREAARLKKFTRLCFVSPPAVLRPSLNHHPTLRTLTEKLWPGYTWMTNMLLDAQAGSKDSRIKMDLRLLRLKLVTLMTTAPDYADQAFALHNKTLLLNELSGIAPSLTPEQRAVVELEWSRHQQQYGDFPRRRSLLIVSESGLDFSEYPDLHRGAVGALGPQIWIGQSGGVMVAPNVTRGRAP